MIVMFAHRNIIISSIRCSHLSELTHLDLSGCIFNGFSLTAVVDLPNLTTLILFNIRTIETELPALCMMKKLTALDISTCSNGTNLNGHYENPNQVQSIRKTESPVTSIPTILSSVSSYNNWEFTDADTFRHIWNKSGWHWCSSVQSKRFNQKLRYSWISKSSNESLTILRSLQYCTFGVPTLWYSSSYGMLSIIWLIINRTIELKFDICFKISGEANEEQILTSAVVYQDRPIMLTKV